MRLFKEARGNAPFQRGTFEMALRPFADYAAGLDKAADLAALPARISEATAAQ